MNSNPRALFISHGGGPMPLLGDPGHKDMIACLQSIAGQISRPSAMIVVSAHWEEAIPTITAAARPPLIYDYYGFPEESYSIEYPCPGAPELAQQLHQLLEKQGFTAALDEQRGFDHGLFIPLKIMYPEADIPCLQVSLMNSLDPAEHIALGKALDSLVQQDVLLIGSGFTFHNMRAFFNTINEEQQSLNHEFEDWLKKTCSDPDMSEQQRAEQLVQWDKAPGARYCHPREEHLLPLHVCYGLTQSACTQSFELQILDRKASMYLW